MIKRSCLDFAKDHVVSAYYRYRDIIKESPLRYKDIKDLHVFDASYKYWITGDPNKIMILDIPGKIKRDRKVTLQEALKLLKTQPELFNAKVLSHLYKYVYLYDRNIIDKIQRRQEKKYVDRRIKERST